MASASLRISTLYLGIVILGVLATLSVRADEVTEIAAPTEIEAKAYDLKTIRPSHSGRVYLFQKNDEGLPAEGKIFLLRQGDTPAMALRVLKTYPSTKQIAAKKLLPYDGFSSLKIGSEYRAFEKVGDKVSPVPPTPEDLKDLKELEGSPPEDLSAGPVTKLSEPPALESESPPPPAPPEKEAVVAETPPTETPANSGSEDAEIKESDDDDDSDEVGSYFPNFFTMSVGLLAKMNVPGPDSKLGGGLFYARNFSTAFAGEVGFYYYKSSGDVDGTTVTTTILPIMGLLRYQYRFGELWTGYAYGGFVYPYVGSNLGATTDQLAQIQSINPALGVGAFLQTGPNWYLRINLGIESTSVGVMLRY